MDIVSKRRRTRGGRDWGQGACLAAALALALPVSLPGRAVAQTPTPDQVYANCTLNSTALSGIQSSISPTASDPLAGNVAFIVVYTLGDNDGQEFTKGPNKGAFTGPVICVNGSAVAIQARGQDDPIPNAGGATGVTTLDAEEAFVLRYQVVGGANNGKIEKVFCHSVENQVFCYRVFPTS